MDSLALLCNLYGDGPATLRRLREAGCGSLEAVAALDPHELAGRLRTSARAAQRFRTECRLLRDRIDPPAESPPAQAALDSGPADPLLREVLSVWRERDAADARAEPEPEESSGAGTSQAPDQPEGRPAGVPLHAGALDGLDPGLAARLARVGVRWLEDLVQRDALGIARDAGLPYTRILRLQQLARRRLGAPLSEDHAGEGASEPGTLWPSPGPARAAPGRGLAPAPPSSGDADAPSRFSPAEAPAPAQAAPLEDDLERHAALVPYERMPVPAPATGSTPEAAGPFA